MCVSWFWGFGSLSRVGREIVSGIVIMHFHSGLFHPLVVRQVGGRVSPTVTVRVDG